VLPLRGLARVVAALAAAAGYAMLAGSDVNHTRCCSHRSSARACAARRHLDARRRPGRLSVRPGVVTVPHPDTPCGTPRALFMRPARCPIPAGTSSTRGRRT
jgi:hypothetical protein